MNIYELYGKQTEQLEQLSEGFTKTLKLLRDIKDKKVNIKNVELSGGGWEIKDKSKPVEI